MNAPGDLLLVEIDSASPHYHRLKTARFLRFFVSVEDMKTAYVDLFRDGTFEFTYVPSKNIMYAWDYTTERL